MNKKHTRERCDWKKCSLTESNTMYEPEMSTGRANIYIIATLHTNRAGQGEIFMGWKFHTLIFVLK